MIVDAISIVLSPFLWALNWFGQILLSSGAMAVYLAIFAATVVTRLIIRPFIGEQSNSRKDNE